MPQPPPKKKRKMGNPSAAPGIAAQYLREHYSTLQEAPVDLRKGHALHLCRVYHGGQAAAASHMRNPFSSSEWDSRLVSSTLLMATRRESRLRALKQEKQMTDFIELCQQPFITSKPGPALSPQPGPAPSPQTEPAPSPQPEPASSPQTGPALNNKQCSL